MPGRTVLGAAVTLLILAACHTTITPVGPSPTPQGPSQTAADAKRDGVPPVVAALTLDDRTQLSVDVSPSITTDEGVWRITRPGATNYPYGEVLLLDGRRTTILKAFPLPNAPPYYLAMNDDAIYCAHPGDGAIPNTTVCRIDRRSQKMTLRTFPPNAPLEIYDFQADNAGVWAKDTKGTWTKLDPKTLTIVERGTTGPTSG